MTDPFQVALSRISYQPIEMDTPILDLLQEDMLNAMREEYRLKADKEDWEDRTWPPVEHKEDYLGNRDLPAESRIYFAQGEWSYNEGL